MENPITSDAYNDFGDVECVPSDDDEPDREGDVRDILIKGPKVYSRKAETSSSAPIYYPQPPTKVETSSSAPIHYPQPPKKVETSDPTKKGLWSITYDAARLKWARVMGLVRPESSQRPTGEQREPRCSANCMCVVLCWAMFIAYLCSVQWWSILFYDRFEQEAATLSFEYCGEDEATFYNRTAPLARVSTIHTDNSLSVASTTTPDSAVEKAVTVAEYGSPLYAEWMMERQTIKILIKANADCQKTVTLLGQGQSKLTACYKHDATAGGTNGADLSWNDVKCPEIRTFCAVPTKERRIAMLYKQWTGRIWDSCTGTMNMKDIIMTTCTALVALYFMVGLFKAIILK